MSDLRILPHRMPGQVVPPHSGTGSPWTKCPVLSAAGGEMKRKVSEES